ncbi:helicase C-terminal domain-containing protein [Actinocrispum sp. NPDC049592]|uniref:helicase C-terminal domain-containing protein n=1 Tax=Actinocrispum sp. NPDC049592 TaxID=3154835 RepID=UPI0034129923
MSTGSFAEYLATLGENVLAELLQARPDVCVEPVPRGFEQLAQRLSGPESLVAALQSVDRDAIVVGQSVAALGSTATVDAIVRLVGAPEATVRDVLGELCGRGLAWFAAETVSLPERLAMHWSAETGGGRSAAAIARSVLVEDLRSAVEAWGIEATGLRKPELIARLVDVLSDFRRIVTVVRDLPKPARDRIDQLRGGYGQYYPGYAVRNGPGASADRMLVAAGLALRLNGHWEMPREVGVAAWLAQRELLLTGRPELSLAEATAETALVAAQAAIPDFLRVVAALLEEAESSSIAALKKGGVGSRERARLAAKLAVPADVLALGIDLAYAAGLLGHVDTGYAPTERYVEWRDASQAHRWAVLANAWFALEHAPTSREIQGDKEVPPPLPVASAAGGIRRAMVHAALSGFSVRSAGAHVDWFFPLHGYDDAQLKDKAAATLREAEVLGVAAADRVTECGEALFATTERALDPTEAVNELADRVAGVLVEPPCTVILQSDLTAVVSGRPPEAVSRLLRAAAVSETSGAAGVWRFGPASVRAALDSGWTATQLLAELTALSDRPLPQPLEYLITDAARRHGQVRVRGTRSVVLADEATVTEILHTRSLAKLQLAQVAPTVLCSPLDLDEVLTRLRAAGLSPVTEDTSGNVIVEIRPEHRASTPDVSMRAASRARLSAAELAERLLADPAGEISGGADISDTFDRLAGLNPALDEAQLMVLSDAIDHQRDVRITYRSKTGGRTVREIQPYELHDRWLDSWCYLRAAQREFTVANIESVAPVG